MMHMKHVTKMLLVTEETENGVRWKNQICVWLRLLQRFNGTRPENYLNVPNSYYYIIFPFSFADFVEIWLKFGVHLDGNLSDDSYKQQDTRTGRNVSIKRWSDIISLIFLSFSFNEHHFPQSSSQVKLHQKPKDADPLAAAVAWWRINYCLAVKIIFRFQFLIVGAVVETHVSWNMKSPPRNRLNCFVDTPS